MPPRIDHLFVITKNWPENGGEPEVLSTGNTTTREVFFLPGSKDCSRAFVDFGRQISISTLPKLLQCLRREHTQGHFRNGNAGVLDHMDAGHPFKIAVDNLTDSIELIAEELSTDSVISVLEDVLSEAAGANWVDGEDCTFFEVRLSP
jgi:hypothetical protein